MADTYTVACNRCYSWQRTGLGKKRANMEAVWHMNENPGHSCSLHKEEKKSRGGQRAETNPPRAGQIMSRHVMAVVYRNVSDDPNVVRVHGFGDADIHLTYRGDALTIRNMDQFPDVHMIAESDGSVRLVHKNPGKSLWQEFK